MSEGNKYRNKTSDRRKMREFLCTLLFVTRGCSNIFSCSFSRKSQEIDNKFWLFVDYEVSSPFLPNPASGYCPVTSKYSVQHRDDIAETSPSSLNIL
jgi:hypothetical protein